MNRSVAVVRVVGWVHKAYPNGVDAEDRGALATLLSSYLSGDQVVELLGGPVPGGNHTEQLPRVAARLVAVGWPLADPSFTEEEAGGPITRAVGGIVNWLRAGYPEGVPATDFIPLVAILERRLTKREVKAVRKELEMAGLLQPDQGEIGDAIATVINESATQHDIDRVTEHLRKKGWPVELED
ncbi:MAG: DUF3349 domain-containing protein [Nocardioides sp.]